MSYVKLQDAYVAEKGTHVGNWYEIGYVMKNSNNFYYCNKATGSCQADDNDNAEYSKATASTTESTGWAQYWNATNIATLNDCAANQNWNLATSQNTSVGGAALYKATVSA